MEDSSKTLILIPGPWKDDKEFVAVVERSLKYIFLGKLLMKLNTKENFTSFLSFDNKKEAYKESFPELTDNNPHEINSIFFIEVEPGPIESYIELCQAISFILEIGGLGVKILNSGRQTFISKHSWEKTSFTKDIIFRIFVISSCSDKGVFTLGMHNFNQKNIFTPLTADNEALSLINTFADYILNENPIIKSGETFSFDMDSPFFVIFESDDKELAGPENAPYNNLGFWKLWPQAWLTQEP